MSNSLKFRWVPTDSESHRNGPADVQDKGCTNYASRICQGSYPYVLLRSFPHRPNKCILEYVSGRKKVKIPWGKICEDPSSWIEPECVPNGFQWADPSKIRIGDIFPLFEHWRERQKHHLSPLIWVPTCPFLRNVSPSFEDRQQYNSNNSIPSSSSDDDNSEFSSHEQCLHSNSSRFDYIVNSNPNFSNSYIIYNLRPGSGESADHFHVRNQSPNSDHGDEWGGIEDIPMSSPSPSLGDAPQEDLGSLDEIHHFRR